MRRKATLRACLVALCLVLAAVSAVQAQVAGLFYQEVEKDGRIYVFNTPEKLKSWEATGDMGVAITLISRGPNGETVVAENETAADLYFFKHNLPGYDRPTPKAATIPFDVSWKDGKTTIKSKSAELAISNRIQLRFTEELPEVGDDVGSFRIRRAKTKFEGWAYTKDLTYEVQLNWPDTANPLEDVAVNYDFTKGKKLFMLKAGQYKVPFGRQELTSSGSQEFVDRSIVSGRFARGRDIGVQLWGNPLGNKLDWRVGLFNGNGRTTSRNDNDKYQLNARLTFQPFGDVKYSEADFESTDKPLFAISGQYENNERPTAAAGTTPAFATEKEIVGADVVFKFKGLFLYGEWFDASNERSAGLSDFDDDGLVVQAGYLFNKKAEVGLRWAAIDPNTDRDNDEQEERGAVFGYYLNKHAHKLQADYRQLETKSGASSVTNDEFRLQYQLIF
jgi:phosphate-selective porin OprO and OprP